MAEDWGQTRRLANLLSSTGLEEIFHNHTGYVNDYFGRVVNFLNSANIDKRNVAFGADISNFVYLIAHDCSPQWADTMWSNTYCVQLWEDILSGIQPGTKTQILTQLVTPAPDALKAMSGDDRHYTLINGIDVRFLEEFMFNHPDGEQFGDLSYSVVNQQDIEAGETDGMFDLVRVWDWISIKVTRQLIKKLLDAVKVGGILVINNASDEYSLYSNPNTAHWLRHYDVSRLICEDSRFRTYHIPFEVGVVVAKRLG